MKFMRLHWFDVGFFLALAVAGMLIFVKMTALATLLWVSLITLFLHQLEEYRYPGYFPGMMNTVMFKSRQPDRYPLNANTAFLINVFVGWGTYLLAALFAEKAIWLGIAAILVSVGNFFAHTFLFNIKGKTFYNPGMLTAILLFVPVSIIFFVMVTWGGLASPLDWAIGVVLGVVLNVVGILKMIDWLKDENSPYIFPERFLLPAARKQHGA